MKKIILSVFFITLFSGYLKAQETPPAGLKSVNGQFYINLSDSSIWHQKGAPYGWERLARYKDINTLSAIVKLKNDSTGSTGYATRIWTQRYSLLGSPNIFTADNIFTSTSPYGGHLSIRGQNNSSSAYIDLQANGADDQLFMKFLSGSNYLNFGYYASDSGGPSRLVVGHTGITTGQTTNGMQLLAYLSDLSGYESLTNKTAIASSSTTTYPNWLGVQNYVASTGSAKLNINTLPFTIFTQTFLNSTAPLTGFTGTAGWAVSATGYGCSTNGGIANFAGFNAITTIDQTSVITDVSLSDSLSVFRVVRKPLSGQLYGTLAEINGTTKRLKFYAAWDGVTLPAVVDSVAIPFTLHTGRPYLVKLVKYQNTNQVVLIDTYSQDSISLTHTNTLVNTSVGRQWDSPGVQFVSGNIKIRDFTYGTSFPKAPKVLITGHSFVEGLNINNYSYSYLLYAALNGDVAIAGRGGEYTANLLLRNDIDFFQPKYHIVDCATNDSNYATWVANMQTYINKILSNGGIPVLMTATPYTAKQTFINQVNTWIRASGYNYIDAARAVSINSVGYPWNPIYAQADSIHPNVLGHARIFAQMQADAPYIFAQDTTLRISKINIGRGPTGDRLNINGSTVGGSGAVGVNRFGASPPAIGLRHALGTSYAPTALTSGQPLGYFIYRGHNGGTALTDADYNIGGAIVTNNTEAFTPSQAGSAMGFYLAPQGTNPNSVGSLTQYMTLSTIDNGVLLSG